MFLNTWVFIGFFRLLNRISDLNTSSCDVSKLPLIKSHENIHASAALSLYYSGIDCGSPNIGGGSVSIASGTYFGGIAFIR